MSKNEISTAVETDKLISDAVNSLPARPAYADPSSKPYTLAKKIDYYGEMKAKDDVVYLDDEQADRLRASGHIA